jgi:hypothetical protein
MDLLKTFNYHKKMSQTSEESIDIDKYCIFCVNNIVPNTNMCYSCTESCKESCEENKTHVIIYAIHVDIDEQSG